MTTVNWKNIEELAQRMDDAVEKVKDAHEMCAEEEIEYDAEHGYFDYYEEE